MQHGKQQAWQIQGSKGIPVRSRRRLTRDDPDPGPCLRCLALPCEACDALSQGPKRAPTGGSGGLCTCKKSDDTGARLQQAAVSRLFSPMKSPQPNSNLSAPEKNRMLRRPTMQSQPMACTGETRPIPIQASPPTPLRFRNRYPNAAIPERRVGT